MRYADAFSLHRPRETFDLLFSRARKAKALDDELADFARERARVEENYAKELLKLSKRTLSGSATEYLGTFSTIWDDLAAGLAEASSAHSTFAADISEKVEKRLRGRTDNDMDYLQLKSNESEVLKLSKDYEEKYAKYVKLKTKSEKKKQEKTDTKLAATLTALVEAKGVLDKDGQGTLDRLHFIELNRLTAIKDAISQLLALHLERLTNETTKVEALSTKLKNVDPQEDVNQFCLSKGNKAQDASDPILATLPAASDHSKAESNSAGNEGKFPPANGEAKPGTIASAGTSKQGPLVDEEGYTIPQGRDQWFSSTGAAANADSDEEDGGEGGHTGPKFKIDIKNETFVEDDDKVKQALSTLVGTMQAVNTVRGKAGRGRKRSTASQSLPAAEAGSSSSQLPAIPQSTPVSGALKGASAPATTTAAIAPASPAGSMQTPTSMSNGSLKSPPLQGSPASSATTPAVLPGPSPPGASTHSTAASSSMNATSTSLSNISKPTSTGNSTLPTTSSPAPLPSTSLKLHAPTTKDASLISTSADVSPMLLPIPASTAAATGSDARSGAKSIDELFSLASDAQPAATAFVPLKPMAAAKPTNASQVASQSESNINKSEKVANTTSVVAAGQGARPARTSITASVLAATSVQPGGFSIPSMATPTPSLPSSSGPPPLAGEASSSSSSSASVGQLRVTIAETFNAIMNMEGTPTKAEIRGLVYFEPVTADAETAAGFKFKLRGPETLMPNPALLSSPYPGEYVATRAVSRREPMFRYAIVPSDPPSLVPLFISAQWKHVAAGPTGAPSTQLLFILELSDDVYERDWIVDDLRIHVELGPATPAEVTAAGAAAAAGSSAPWTILTKPAAATVTGTTVTWERLPGDVFDDAGTGKLLAKVDKALVRPVAMDARFVIKNAVFAPVTLESVQGVEFKHVDKSVSAGKYVCVPEVSHASANAP